MTDTSLTRVHYFERQHLGTHEFEDEQQYHLAMRRRHNIALHSWGIAAGLELHKDEDGNLLVLPGMAIDGYGRELVLAERRLLSKDEFNAKNTDTLDVWLEYELIESDVATRGQRSCEGGETASSSRWQEQPLVRLSRYDPNASNRRTPATVPDEDQNFAPFQNPPDAPQRDWPVFLGQIVRVRQRSGQPTYSVSMADRPYAGLVGAEINTPSGLATVQLGGKKPNQERQFAVFVRDELPGVNDQATAGNRSAETPALEIDGTGSIKLNGPTTIQGNLAVYGAVGFKELEDQTIPAQDAARPWQMYYVKSTEGSSISRELRLELASNTSLVIGAWDAEQEQFTPSLTVADSGNVTVHGDLIIEGLVKGQLGDNIKRAEPQVTQRAQEVIFANVIGSATSGLPGTTPRQPAENDLDVLKRALTTDLGRSIAAQSLAANLSQLTVFLERLLDQATAPTVAQVIMDSSVLAQVLGIFISNGQTSNLFTTQLLQESNADKLASLLRRVLESGAGRAAIVKLLHDDETARKAFITDLLADNVCRDTVVGLLLEKPETLVQSLLKQPKEALEAFIDFWLTSAKPASQRTFIVERVIKAGIGRPALADALIDDSNGRTAIAKALIAKLKNKEMVKEFANKLKNPDVLKDNPTFIDDLVETLKPGA